MIHAWYDSLFGQDRQWTAQHLTTTHTTVTELTNKIQGSDHKLYMDNNLSSPHLFDDLATKQSDCCGTVRPNRKGMPQDFRLARVNGSPTGRPSSTEYGWLDSDTVEGQTRCVYSDRHDAPAEGSFCDNSGKAIKPEIVTDYNRHIGYVDKGYRVENSYSINRRTWMWTKKISQRDFRLTLVRNLWHRLNKNGVCQGQ